MSDKERRRLLKLLYDGLFTDGSHHKQWCLRQIADELDAPVDAWANELGYEPDDPELEGVAP